MGYRLNLWYGATDLASVVLEDIMAEYVASTFNVFFSSLDLAAFRSLLMDSIFFDIFSSFVFELVGHTPNFMACFNSISYFLPHNNISS